MAIDKRFCNVILLGFAFMFVFTAFQTMGNIEQTILDSIKNDDPNFTGNGYTSLAVIYTVFALCNWFVPSVISITGPRLAMLFGAITYALFILSFLWPKTWLLYAASFVIGIGAAVIWTGQGNYLTLNSDQETMPRNSGIFWAMLQASMFFGNIFVFYQFQGQTHIDEHTRVVVFITLTVVAVVGIVFVIALRPPPRAALHINVDGSVQPPEGPIQALKGAMKLFVTRDMLLLFATFFYTGIELSFFSGVYSSCIGFTQQLGENAKRYVGLSGIFIGLGEVLGGLLFGILGSSTIKFGRGPIVIAGYVVHLLSFFLIFLNLPNAAPLGNTEDTSYINPPLAWVAILCSFLLGFGDSCYNTQIYSILGGLYHDISASAFALFKFTQSIAAAACFFYATHVGLYVHLVILVALATLGTITFCIVETLSRRNIQAKDADQHTNSTISGQS